MDKTSISALVALPRIARPRSPAVATITARMVFTLKSETGRALLAAALQERPLKSHLGNHIDTWA
jgi:hypothetical protein